MLSSIRYHDGFMGQRIGPTKCLAFHPYKVSLWGRDGGGEGRGGVRGGEGEGGYIQGL